MADLAILTAVSGAGWESQLVSTIDQAPDGLYVARRCVDVPDLLATAAAGHGRVALLAADFRRLDRDVLARLRGCGVAVVGVTEPGSGGTVDRLRSLGVSTVVPADITPDLLATTLHSAVGAMEVDRDLPDGDWATDSATVLGAGGGAEAGPAEMPRGEVVAVWGAYGAPGRTTLAINLAGELAALGRQTLLVDADTYGAAIASSMGLLDEAPGLAGAARSANNGGLDVGVIAHYARQVMPGLRVLSGINRPSRWPELRSSSLDAVFELARAAAEFTVVDAGFCVESGDDLDVTERNAATLTALHNADRVIAVGTGDIVGLARLVRGLSDIHDLMPEAQVDVVINKVRRTFAGRDPEREITGALNRYASITPTAYIPDDPQAVDAALAQGLTLSESAPGSDARRAIQAIGRRVAGVAQGSNPVEPRRRRAGPASWRLIGRVR